MEREHEKMVLDSVATQAAQYGMTERQVSVFRGLARIAYSYGRCDVLEEQCREAEKHARSIGTEKPAGS